MSLVNISKIVENVALISRNMFSFGVSFNRLFDAETLAQGYDAELILSALIEDCLKDIRLKCGRAESIDVCGEWSEHSFS